MAVYALGDDEPVIDPAAYVSDEAVVIGRVVVGPDSSIWPCAVLRGDYGRIEIGARTSVQDGTVLHCTPSHPTVIGDGCVVGHNAYLEGCVVEDGSLVGSMSSVLNGARIGRGAVVAAGAVVTHGFEVPPLGMALGVPARVVEDAVEPDAYAAGVQRYVENARRFSTELRRIA